MQFDGWDILVGTEDCSTRMVSLRLKDASVAKKISEFSRQLGLKWWELLNIKFQAWYHDRSTADTLDNILKIWTSRYTTQSTLGVLLYHLDEMGLDDDVEDLEKYFKIRTRNSIPRLNSYGGSMASGSYRYEKEGQLSPSSVDTNNNGMSGGNTHRRSKSSDNALLIENGEMLKVTDWLKENKKNLNEVSASVENDHEQVQKSYSPSFESHSANTPSLTGIHRTTEHACDNLEGLLSILERDRHAIRDLETAYSSLVQTFSISPLLPNDIEQADTGLSYAGVTLAQKQDRRRKYVEKLTGRIRTRQDDNYFNCSIICCFGWVVLVGLVCGSFLYIYMIHTHINYNILAGDPGSTLKSLNVSNSNPDILRTKSNQQVFHIHSYKDFEEILSKVSFNQVISIVLLMDNPAAWPTDKAITSSHKIVELKIVDSHHPEAITQILEGIPTAKTVTIKYSKSFTCQTKQIDIHEKTSLNNIEKLSLEISNECADFYNTIFSRFAFPKLQIFRCVDCVISTKNVNNIQDLLCNARKSLQTLEFLETTWLTSVFVGKIGTQIKLESLQIDIVEDSNPDIEYIHPSFNRIFPELKRFISASGSVPLKQFNKLSECKKIEYMQVGVKIPKKEGKVNLVDLISITPKLKEARLFLDFEDIDEGSYCEIQGYEEAKEILGNRFVCESNCITAADRNRMAQISSEYNSGRLDILL